MIDVKIDGADRKILAHPARNGFTYTMDRLSGQFLKAAQHIKEVNWTEGIDPKTGKPIDYDPTKDLQAYAAPANQFDDKVKRRICPSITGGTNFWPSTYSRKTGLMYMTAYEGCGSVTTDVTAHVKGKFNGGDRKSTRLNSSHRT